jgi:hypothetical protein
MTPMELLNRYIQGDTGAYYFDIEIIWGRTISGGMFYSKVNARKALIIKLAAFLDDPSELLATKKGKS